MLTTVPFVTFVIAFCAVPITSKFCFDTNSIAALEWSLRWAGVLL